MLMTGATSITLMVGLMASGVTIAVAVIAMAVMIVLQNDEARRQANAVEHVFWDRADSETVRKMVMDECKAVQPRFQAIPAIVDGLNRGDAAITADFNERAVRADALNKKMSELTQKLAERRQKIVEAHAHDKQPITESRIQDELSDSPESAALIEAGKDAGQLNVIDQLIINLIRFDYGATNAGADIDLMAQQELEAQDSVFQNMKAQLPALIERRNRVFTLSRSISQTSIAPDYVHLLQVQVETQKRLSEFYKEWETSYVSLIRVYLLRGNANASIAHLSNLSKRMQEYAKMATEGGPLLQKLIQRSDTVISLLQAGSPR
jgi:hypothetical protein